MDLEPEPGVRAPAASSPAASPPPDSSASAPELMAAGRLLLGQITSMRTELQRLSASLLQQAATIIEALDELETAAMADPPPPAPTQASLPVPVEPPPRGPVDPPAPALKEVPAAVKAPASPPAPVEPPAPAVRPPDDAATAAAREDARLVALDMALGGSTREEIDRALEARFDLPDRGGLVDEVLAAIG